MKAIVYTRYGSPDVLQLQEVAKPVLRDRDVLIKVYATTVTGAERLMRTGMPLWAESSSALENPEEKSWGLS